MISAPKVAKATDRETNERIVDAARAAIAERGLNGAGLRVVAERAGVSVGTINYRIGDRAALLGAVVAREIEVMAVVHADWRARPGTQDAIAAGGLPDLVAAWLDDGTTDRRVSTIVTCELALAEGRSPGSIPGIAALLGAGEMLWRDLLPPDAARWAPILAGYCFDEQPFSLLLAEQSDYRLLRASTIRALLRDPWPETSAAASRWHMALVERLAVPAAAALDEGPAPQGLKAAITQHIADLLMTHGFGSLSHRLVAQAADTPVSTIAHHFPMQRDLMLGGVEALYRRMRAALRQSEDAATTGAAVLFLTHEAALLGLRDPALVPFAIDMRRRRAENVYGNTAEALGIDADTTRDITQAVIMAVIGDQLRSPAGRRNMPSFRGLLSALNFPVRSYEKPALSER
ncbi:AcrR family transcriptional regulator [Sphingomonas zeicaulis]|uniref:TetR family transcriptional regulator n=1 Tax=Sphingomonas zeicaulis TaxID=1632740 RepID=UPI003D24CE36